MNYTITLFIRAREKTDDVSIDRVRRERDYLEAWARVWSLGPGRLEFEHFSFLG